MPPKKLKPVAYLRIAILIFVFIYPFVVVSFQEDYSSSGFPFTGFLIFGAFVLSFLQVIFLKIDFGFFTKKIFEKPHWNDPLFQRNKPLIQSAFFGLLTLTAGVSWNMAMLIYHGLIENIFLIVTSFGIGNLMGLVVFLKLWGTEREDEFEGYEEME